MINFVWISDISLKKIASVDSPVRFGALSNATREGHLKSRDEPERKVGVLGERMDTLSAAVLHLGSSLDLATVLQ